MWVGALADSALCGAGVEDKSGWAKEVKTLLLQGTARGRKSRMNDPVLNRAKRALGVTKEQLARRLELTVSCVRAWDRSGFPAMEGLLWRPW